MRSLVLVLLFLLLPWGSPPTDTMIDRLVQQTSLYVDNYNKQLGGLVGEERYVQTATWQDPSAKGRVIPETRERVIMSDFRTTPIGDEWFGIRRVRQVDGIDIDPGFWGLLGEPFDRSTLRGRAQLRLALAYENARFNFGDFNLANVPTFVLDFFRATDIGNYRFEKSAEEDVDGIHAWKVSGSLRNPVQGAPPISALFWIEPGSGRVLRSQIEVNRPQRTAIPSLHMEVRFRFDGALGMLLPATMDETYEGSVFDEWNIHAHAEYSNFRSFYSDVGLDEHLPQPGPSSDLVLNGHNEYALKVDVPVVIVEAWVSKDNVPVLDLKTEDFIVTENHIPQAITNFSSVNTPFDVLLLFDRSDSTTREMPLMERAARGLIDKLRPQDRIGIASFGPTVRMLTKWTDTREQVINSFSRISAGPTATAFYNSLRHSLVSELFPVEGRRRALVVLTDGRDNEVMDFFKAHGRLPAPTEDTEYRQILGNIQSEHVPIYIVALNTDRNQMQGNFTNDEYVQLRTAYPGLSIASDYLKLIRSRLEQIAQVSGRHILFPKTLKDIVPLYEQIGREIATGYSIGYISTVPPETSGYREIEVAARDSSLRVTQSRSGYVVP